jgi:hypothetical protein
MKTKKSFILLSSENDFGAAKGTVFHAKNVRKAKKILIDKII